MAVYPAEPRKEGTEVPGLWPHEMLQGCGDIFPGLGNSLASCPSGCFQCLLGLAPPSAWHVSFLSPGIFCDTGAAPALECLVLHEAEAPGSAFRSRLSRARGGAPSEEFVNCAGLGGWKGSWQNSAECFRPARACPAQVTRVTSFQPHSLTAALRARGPCYAVPIVQARKLRLPQVKGLI